MTPWPVVVYALVGACIQTQRCCEDLQRPAKTCKDLQRPAKTCKDLWRPVKTCGSCGTFQKDRPLANLSSFFCSKSASNSIIYFIFSFYVFILYLSSINYVLFIFLIFFCLLFFYLLIIYFSFSLFKKIFFFFQKYKPASIHT